MKKEFKVVILIALVFSMIGIYYWKVVYNRQPNRVPIAANDQNNSSIPKLYMLSTST